MGRLVPHRRGRHPWRPFAPGYRTIFPLRCRGDHWSPDTFPILSGWNIRKTAWFHVKNQRFLTHSPAGNAAGDHWSPPYDTGCPERGGKGASWIPPPTVVIRQGCHRAGGASWAPPPTVQHRTWCKRADVPQSAPTNERKKGQCAHWCGNSPDGGTTRHCRYFQSLCEAKHPFFSLFTLLFYLPPLPPVAIPVLIISRTEFCHPRLQSEFQIRK